MLDNLTYGPDGYSTHEEIFAVENEHHSDSRSLQTRRPRYDSPHCSKQHMPYNTGTGTQGSYPDAWHGNPNKYPNGPNGCNGGNMPQGGWSTSPNGYYNNGPGGQLPGKHGPAGFGYRRAGPELTSAQNYGMHYESYDDYANGVHNGRQFEWKAL